MQKRIITITLSVTMVLLSVVPCFANNIATPSAIKSTKALSDTKAAGDTVAPVSSSYNDYYYTGNGITSYSGTLSSWGQIITLLTDSFSRSIQSLKTSIAPLIDGLETPVTNINTNLSTITNRLPINFSTIMSNLDSDSLSIKNDLSDILDILTDGLDIDLGSPYQPYFMPADDYDFNNNDWDYYYIRTVDEWGTVSSTTFTNNNILMGLKRLLVNLNNNNTYGFRNLARGVGGTNNNDFVPKLYNTDLSTTNADKISVWRSILQYGENTSMFLSRLGFVLASDEEIEARQAAANNQEAVVDNFIKPTGTGSASASDFADVAAAGSSIKDALDSNVSAGNAFTSLNSNSDAWNWFSQSTLNSLDSSTSQNRKSANSDTPLLDSYYSDLIETLRLK